MPILVAGALLTTGCLSLDLGGADVDEGAFGNLLASSTPLWHAPQDFPHPAFNWPTLTNPPTGDDVPEWWKPIPATELPASIEGLAHHANLGGEDLPMGGGIALFGSLAAVPSYEGDTYFVSIADPENPEVLSSVPESTRGAAMMPFPDGRLIAVFSTSANVLVYDITDPYFPEQLPTLDPANGGHKVAVLPGTPFVYNANSLGAGEGYPVTDPAGQVEIFDLTNPEDPQLVQEFQNGYGCHHIYFHINPAEDKYRGLCAGLEMTQIWDVADPANPVIISEIPMPHGDEAAPGAPISPAMLSHYAVLSNDGNTLIVGDETGGGLAPGCDVYAETPLGTFSGPIGNLWFYDVTDEENPELKSWLSPTHHYATNPPMPGQGPNVGGVSIPAGCTAHHGRLIPDNEGRDLLAMAFYGAGVVLVDFSDVDNPFIVDQWNDETNVWEVWYYNGYLFTGDLNRGFDVFKFT
jgi:hypothetical protein